MKKYKCLIVDDEKLAQELLESYIQKIPSLEIVASCSTAMEALPFLAKQEIDLLFLDIQLPDLTGIEFLQSLKRQPATIFTTAYSEYAMEGYEMDVVDYLLKPIVFERFFKAVTKAIERLAASPAPPTLLESVPASATSESYFFIKSEGKILRIAFEEVLFIEALQKYIRLYTPSKKVISLQSLSHVQEMLPPHFVRIHRSYLVNINKVDSIEGNLLKIKEHQLPISKGQREQLMVALRERGLY